MVSNNNEAGLNVGPIETHAGSSAAGEIDLYDQLIAFAELSPEEQRRSVDRPRTASVEKQTDPLYAEPVPIDRTTNPLEVETTERVARVVSQSEKTNAYGEISESSPELFEGSSPSGPLSSLSLPPNLVFTGALSRGVCLACGAESGEDDLFCMTCGVFIDDIASAPPLNSACSECSFGIAADEIFCPQCGTVLPSARTYTGSLLRAR
jgi:hypothetical protein